MFKKNVTCIVLIVFLHFLLACSTTNTQHKTANFDFSSQGYLETQTFGEIKIIMQSGDIHRGKIISLEKEDMRFLPFPYWNVEYKKIYMPDISSIETMKKKGNPGKAFAYGFGVTFILIGAIAAGSSKYDEDYEMGLAGSAAAAGTVGLLSLVISGISTLSKKSKFDFTKMSDQEKVSTIKKIIGY